jgi:hypothetical protein
LLSTVVAPNPSICGSLAPLAPARTGHDLCKARASSSRATPLDFAGDLEFCGGARERLYDTWHELAAWTILTLMVDTAREASRDSARTP